MFETANVASLAWQPSPKGVAARAVFLRMTSCDDAKVGTGWKETEKAGVNQTQVSWNQVVVWLRQVEGLRDAV